VNVTPCPFPLGDLVPSDYLHRARIFSIYVLSMGVYAIEHPEKTTDETAQYVAGVEGALKAYQAILKNKASARSEDLDDLLEKQGNGKLAEFVKTASHDCRTP
jgi:ADP-ribosylglycohydrolase